MGLDGLRRTWKDSDGLGWTRIGSDRFGVPLPFDLDPPGGKASLRPQPAAPATARGALREGGRLEVGWARPGDGGARGEMSPGGGGGGARESERESLDSNTP